uniref:amino acid transporter AVT1C-like n=1 Tax=Erigeron canadensis TaxID=72917 RepID=UPI001CB9033A|nr:amino acid transporter AVT1C-like [Erigeron canadensis]
MKDTESDYIFLFESDKNEDEHIDLYREEIEDNKDSKGDSYPSWPQSYRVSMDVYGDVSPPKLTFLGSTNVSTLGGPFLSNSSLPPESRRRITTDHKVFGSLCEPLLPQVTDDDGHHIYPADQCISSAKELSQHEKSPDIRQSSFGQAVVNVVNVLCGVALLSTPYAMKEGGWFGLSILFIFSVLSFYTGIIIRYCLDSQPGLSTYPDIGEAAFGLAGRLIISIFFYVELYASCVEFIIMESDSLSSLFPNTHLNLGGHQLSSHYLFAIMITLIVLPTVWLRDLSFLSYISAGGVLVTILVVICLFWVGLVDNIGFQHDSTRMLNLSSLPVSIGIYGYCYAGHAVLPHIYMSMETRNQYPLVLLTSFAICTLLYAGAATMGYMMFGESIESQFTLNLPSNFLASKIAVWATVISPLTKYAITISPVARSLEELIPSDDQRSHIYSILFRTTLVISSLVVAICFPFFALVMSLIGSLMTMLVSFIFPCVCFLRMLGVM